MRPVCLPKRRKWAGCVSGRRQQNYRHFMQWAGGERSRRGGMPKEAPFSLQRLPCLRILISLYFISFLCPPFIPLCFSNSAPRSSISEPAAMFRQHTPLRNLPQSVLLEVLTFLIGRELSACQLVSRQFNLLIARYSGSTLPTHSELRCLQRCS